MKKIFLITLILGVIILNAETKTNNTSFFFVKKIDAQNLKTVTFQGIPFEVQPEGNAYKNLAAGVYVVGKPADKLFFLGMTAEKPECSEWWGSAERLYDNTKRLFIGDKVGQINIVFDDNTQEIFPLLFGVNIWNYELLNPLKPGETLTTYFGYHPEPFASDTNAAKLLEDSLVLMTNDERKDFKYIFALDFSGKTVREISLVPDSSKVMGFRVTGITGLKPGNNLKTNSWESTDKSFYLKRKYFPAMDKLARRLYQFDDELPEKLAPDSPENYSGPKVKFNGCGSANIFANVYMYNLNDIMKNKVDEDGMMHTSSKNAPTFGSYVGCGTFRNGAGSYYSHIWTRDVGRSVIEAQFGGARDRAANAANKALEIYLYDPSTRYKQPNWKRIANASTLNNSNLWESVSGKENDGHGTMMLFVYHVARTGGLSPEWLKENWKTINDAAEWICWQMENPKESHFNGVLHSETEASTQKYGEYDLFSNTMACYGLRALARVAEQTNHKKEAERWSQKADELWAGIIKTFTTEHPRYGTIFVDDANDCWTYEYKRFAPLMLSPDVFGYDLAKINPELYKICENTYKAQKEDFFNYASGRQMGYGQAFITQTAILLDESKDMAGYLEKAGAFCYHHTEHNYIVPEGVICHPSGRFWFRNGDLGNSIQQAEIVKCGRLLLGIDDMESEAGLKIIPRLPEGWNSIEVEDYPVLSDGESTTVNMSYTKENDGYRLKLTSALPIKINEMRFGQFPADTKELIADGKEVKLFKVGENIFGYINGQNKPVTSINIFCRM
ncbi:MAG: hypothetical protein DRI44_07780 [Chlamydiae bacterium]|nr:MAG: hypothetical protein DRI44_07780 [Chlamydiota bacterium]